MVSWRNNELGEKEKTEIVHKTLPYIFYPLIAMFTALSAGHYLTLEPEESAIMLPLASGTVLTLILLLLCHVKGLITLNLVYPVGVGVIFLVAFNSLTHLYLSEQDHQSTNVAFIIMATGTFLLSLAWWLLTVMVVLVAWLAIALSIDQAFNWVHYGYMILLSLILSYAAFETRRRSITSELQAARKAQESSELAEAFAQQLSNLERVLPMCAWCKKIQTEDQSWQSLEYYVSSQNETGFTHGICDSCEKMLEK